MTGWPGYDPPTVHPMWVLLGLQEGVRRCLEVVAFTCLGELITPTDSLRIPPLPLHTCTLVKLSQLTWHHLKCCVVQLEASVLHRAVSDKFKPEVVVAGGEL